MSPEVNDYLKLNPFFRVRLTEPLTCDLFLEGTTLELPDVRFLQVVASFRTPRRVSEATELLREILGIPHEEADTVLADLRDHRLIVEADREYPELPAIQHWIKRGWIQALMLHMKTRNQAFSDEERSAGGVWHREFFRKAIAKEPPPEIWKSFSGLKSIELPAILPEDEPGEPLEETLLRRRSNRPWRGGSLSLKELALVLHHGNIETVRLRQEVENGLHENPELLAYSAFTALETYVAVFDVNDLAPGLYHYDPNSHRLVEIRRGLFRAELQEISIGQQQAATGACDILITGLWHRYMYRYRHPLAYRALMINTAELAQKYILLSTSLRLSTFLTPNFDNLAADKFLGVNGYEEALLYVVAVG